MSTDEVSSLSNSVPQKILLIGDDPSDFVRKLQVLQKNNRERFNRLWGVCSRLQFVEHLLHSVSFTVRDNIAAASDYYAERTAAYLSATCIDVIAGRKHKAYPRWLAETLQGHTQIAYGTDSLLGLKTPGEVVRAFVESSKQFHANYQQESGIGSNFRRIIRENYEWLTSWLSDTYFITSGDIILQLADINNCSWVQSSKQEKYKRIAEYIFELRNRFTHAVDYQPTLERGGSISIPLFDKRYVFNTSTRTAI